MQGLVARGLHLRRSGTFTQIMSKSLQPKYRSRYLLSQYIEKKLFARFDGCRPYS